MTSLGAILQLESPVVEPKESPGEDIVSSCIVHRWSQRPARSGSCHHYLLGLQVQQWLFVVILAVLLGQTSCQDLSFNTELKDKFTKSDESSLFETELNDKYTMSYDSSLFDKLRNIISKRSMSVTNSQCNTSIQFDWEDLNRIRIKVKDSSVSNNLPTMEALNGTDLTTPNSFRERRPMPEPGSEDDLCLTKGCINTASTLLDNMDLTADPCEDFYQYACGRFRKRTIPDDKTSISVFSEINDALLDQLRLIVAEPPKENEANHYAFAKHIYGLCMNKTHIEETGSKEVLALLKSVGGWPVLEGDEWDVGSFDWKQLVYKFRKEGLSIDYYIDFSVTIDSKNSSKRIIDLDTGSLALSREYLIQGLDNKLVNAYYEYMVDIAVLFGADKERAKKELRESLDFEIKLANISLPLEERRNATKLYNLMTVPELQQKFQSIPWREYLANMLTDEVPLLDDEKIIVDVPSYISSLENIIAHTPKRVQANYAMWRAAASTVSYLNEEFRNRQLKYSTVISGRTEREARWKECVDIASSSLTLSVGSLYVKRFFKEDSKKSAVELVERIREEMVGILNTIDWMDDATRKNALDKAKSMTAHIAYPDELLDDTKLAEFYNGLELRGESYLGAMLNLTKFGTRYAFNRLRKPVNKTEWISHGKPHIVNAFYSSIENSIQFPAGILQGAFFSNDRPKYMNYGAIGFVIGHEITHGFDDQGRQFDKDGNLADWWHEQTKAAYLEKAQCIIWQYGNFTDSQVNLKLNGINTQGENIADNGGVKEAYKAYLKWRDEVGPEKRLPGLQMLDNKQMFWLSAASSWCMVTRDESLRNRIKTGFHSPGEFRVKGPMSNMPDFAKDFACPLGSPMNPKSKCRVW